MAGLSEQSVFTSIESYNKGTSVKKQIFEWSEKLRVLQDETADLAIELIARYQPVATDLRFIRSCMEIAYGFSRFGRYAYDIVEVLETLGPIPDCDKTAVLGMAHTVREMIVLSVSHWIYTIKIQLLNSIRWMILLTLYIENICVNLLLSRMM